MTLAPERTHLYFTRLAVQNVRAFGKAQTLDLTVEGGRPAPWTLILGENGVGKTTLLQCIARMRPIPAVKRQKATVASPGIDVGKPNVVEPELSQFENEEVIGFVRYGRQITTSITAALTVHRFGRSQSSRGRPVEIGIECLHDGKELRKVEFRQHPLRLARPPLIVGYGAARHIGHTNKDVMSERDPTASLFSDAMDLYDAEEILSDMHYAAVTGGRRDKDRLKTITAVLAALLPGELQSRDISVLGPRVPGRMARGTGVQVTTPSGPVPLQRLSLGYQTVFAWTVDLAWRLYSEYPYSKEPLCQPAVVLVDEIDLHLHPAWQRHIRKHLRKHFPAVQFIVTTHSPITAQEALSAGENVCVVRWEGRESKILSDPLEAREWRFDQLLTSDLFGFDSSRSPTAESLLNERLALIRKSRLTKSQKRRLTVLDGVVSSLPTADSPIEQEARDILRESVKLSKLRHRK